MFLVVRAHVIDCFGWICHACCLMSNHFHLMIETPRSNLSRGMGQLNGMATGIPKRKQILRHLPLSEIMQPGRERGDWIREGYREHRYTMQKIATFSGLHHSTVSRIIKPSDENAQNKS